jgi:hypothetical protein
VHSLGGNGGQREGIHIIEAWRRHGEQALDQTRNEKRFKVLRGIVASAAKLAGSNNKNEAHCQFVA